MRKGKPYLLTIPTQVRPIRPAEYSEKADNPRPSPFGLKDLVGNPGLFVLVWLFSFAVVYLSSQLFRQPGYMDAYYYYHIAKNLAEGRGFVEEFIWNYLYLPDAVIHPSNLHWMPLTSIIVAPFLKLFGESFRSAQLPMIVLASLLPPVTFAIAMKVLGTVRQALMAAVLTLFSGYYFIHWSAIDAFGLFSLTVTFALLALCGTVAKPLKTGRKQVILAVSAGIFTALSHLARADGVLLLPVAGSVLVLGHLFNEPDRRISFIARLRPGRIVVLFFLVLVGYLAGMFPWFLHNLEVLGSPLPLGGSQSIFLREYNEFFSYDRELSLITYLDWGIGPILWSKIEVLGRNLLVLLGMEHYLLPFIVLGFWTLRRSSWCMPFFVYGATLYLTMSLVFTFPASRGSMLHSSVALIPWFTCAAVKGIDTVIEAIARRRKHWNPPIAKRNFGIIFVSFSVLFSVVVIGQNAAERDKRYNTYNKLADWFNQNDPAALIMVADPPGYYYSSKKASIVVPNESPEVVVRAAGRYGATYVIIEDSHSRYLKGLYEGTETTPLLTRVDEFDELQIYRVQDEGR